MRHKVTDAGRRSSYGRLDVVCRTVVTIGGMEPGHGSQVLEDTVGQIAGAKLEPGPHGPLFAPERERTIRTGVTAFTLSVLELPGPSDSHPGN